VIMTREKNLTIEKGEAYRFHLEKPTEVWEWGSSGKLKR